LKKRRPDVPRAHIIWQRRRIEHRGEDRRRWIEDAKLLQDTLSAAE
jgi:hypothetical protein